MRWLLILATLALLACGGDTSSLEASNRIVIDRATGSSGAALFDALDRMAQLDGRVVVDFHDKKGRFEILVVVRPENSPTISIDQPSVEVLFQSISYDRQQVSDAELKAKLKAQVAAAERLNAKLILDVSAIESSSSTDAVKCLRLISECGIYYCRLTGHLISEPSK